MKRYQSLVLQKLDICVPGLCIRRLALHRHLPETTAVRPHAHRYAQCLLYVTGHGRQHIGNRQCEIQAGSSVFVPPHVEHAFHRSADRRPICLVLDLDWRGASRKPARVRLMSHATFREVQEYLADLIRMQRESPGGPPLHISATILRILHLLLAGLGLTNPTRSTPLSPVAVKVNRILDSLEAASTPVGQLAQRIGYQQDYLNRLLKTQTGMTLGQMRARTLLARAQGLLRGQSPVGQVASDLGFSDANYFARWFRQQTGSSPSRWRQSMPMV